VYDISSMMIMEYQQNKDDINYVLSHI